MFNVYYNNSIKNDEQGNRSTGKLQFKIVVDLSQIKQYSSFLSNGSNKAELIRFFVSRCERQLLIIGDAKLYVAFDEQCISIKVDGSGELVKDLECNQVHCYVHIMFTIQLTMLSSPRLILMFLLSPSPYLLKFQVTCLFALVLKVMPTSNP